MSKNRYRGSDPKILKRVRDYEQMKQRCEIWKQRAIHLTQIIETAQAVFEELDRPLTAARIAEEVEKVMKKE